MISLTFRLGIEAKRHEFDPMKQIKDEDLYKVNNRLAYAEQAQALEIPILNSLWNLDKDKHIQYVQIEVYQFKNKATQNPVLDITLSSENKQSIIDLIQSAGFVNPKEHMIDEAIA